MSVMGITNTEDVVVKNEMDHVEMCLSIQNQEQHIQDQENALPNRSNINLDLPPQANTNPSESCRGNNGKRIGEDIDTCIKKRKLTSSVWKHFDKSKRNGQKAAAKSKFTWKIPNFSKLTVKKLSSDTFIAGDCKWRLLVYPKGNNVDYLSIYLEVADSSDLPNGWNRDAKFSLAVINQINSLATVRKETQHVFNAKENDWGYTSFFPLSKIKSPTERYLVRDTLTVEGEVHVLSAVHYSKIDSEKQVVQSEQNKAKEPAVETPSNQTPLAQKPVVDTVAPTPLTTEPLSRSEPTAEEVKKPVLLPPPPTAGKILSRDPGSEPVKSSADVQTKCKGLITELSSRKKALKSFASNEISVPSQATSPEIQQQQKEALKGFFNMSLEALQQANCFANIEAILYTLAQNTDNLQEKTTLEEIISRLAEFKASIPNAKAVVETAQARRTSLAEKTAELDSKLDQKQKELSSLESEFSTLSEEEAKIQAEIERLIAKKQEVVSIKKSVSLKLEKANEETCKEIEEWRSLEREMKEANSEWLGAKEKLTASNVRWKLFREDLGLGKLNIS